MGRLAWWELALLAFAAGLLVGSCSIARAQEVSGNQAYFERIADAVYRAEGGARTRHPYGVLSVDTGGDPARAREICIRTIQHRWLEWDGRGDFIEWFGRSYCPVGASNDPGGLNRNWIRNVRYFMGET